VLSILLTSALAADCGFAATEAELHATMDAAEQAYSQLDVAAFRIANDELRLAFPCVDTAVSTATASRVARLRALALATQGNDDGALQALTAAKELDPSYVFPAEVLPEGHALRTAYDGIVASDAPKARLPRPRGVDVLLDGQVDLWRPTHRPTVFQIERDGRVQDTQLLWPGDPAPDYPKVPVTRNRLLYTAAGLGAGALAFYGGAWASRSGLDTAEGADALQGVQRRTNLLTGLSLGFAIGAGASTTAALLVGDRG
jgi:hypothetical protein